MASALGAIRVLDLSDSIAAAWCTRLMADFGAEVTIVEPPAGLRIRQLEPRDARDRSVLATYVLANKQSIALNPSHEETAAVLGDLIESAEVIVQSQPDMLGAAGIDLAALHEARPELVSITITPHGEVGPRAGLPGNDLTTYAWSGWGSINGQHSREPIKGSGISASLTAGGSAYGATLTALCNRELTGRGQHVDVAETEAMAMIFGRSMLRAQYEAAIPGRNSESEMSATFPGPVADGYMAAAARGGPRLPAVLRALELDELAELVPEHRPGRPAVAPPEVEEGVRERFSELHRADIFDLLSPLHFSVGPVWSVAELTEDPHLRARGFFQRPTEEPNEVEFPGSPFRMTATPSALRTSAPAVGEHTQEALRDLAGYDQSRCGALELAGVIAVPA